MDLEIQMMYVDVNHNMLEIHVIQTLMVHQMDYVVEPHVTMITQHIQMSKTQQQQMKIQMFK